MVNVAKEKTEKEQDGSISKTRKIKGIKENQRRERLRQRELNKSDVSLKEVPMEIINEVEEGEDHLDLFRQLRGEGIK
jgi:hypothetical protein